MSRALVRPSLPARCFGALLVSLLVSLLLAACGGSSGSGGGASSGGRSSGGPDITATQVNLLNAVNLGTEGQARFVEFKETGRHQEGEGEFQGCVVEFAGVIEFTGDCEYDGKLRKAGERQNFEAQAEYLKDQQGWKQLTMGLYPL